MRNVKALHVHSLKAAAIASVLILAGCATDGEPVEGDFENANEIPSRPGILETLTGKKLEKSF